MSETLSTSPESLPKSVTARKLSVELGVFPVSISTFKLSSPVKLVFRSTSQKYAALTAYSQYKKIKPYFMIL